MATAVVTGVLGQSGTHLAQLLAEDHIDVIGLVRPGRRCSAEERRRLPTTARLVEWDMSDQKGLESLLREVRPKEFYNLASFSTGVGMYDDPVAIGEVNGLAVTRMLEAVRTIDPSLRFCQASSSEMFGEPLDTPQKETTPFNPRSPYGAAKLYAHNMIGIYRDRFDLFACSAILFNHESSLRTEAFVSRKITKAAASISLGLSSELRLGNLEARRDWSFAGDGARAMRLMLRTGTADDYVVASGETHSVRELCEAAFSHVGLDYQRYVRVSKSDFRPSEARQLVGDPSKARQNLGWRQTVPFTQLVRMMVEADIVSLRGEAANSGA